MILGVGRARGRTRAHDVVVGLLAVSFAVICLTPHAIRFHHASLYGDDVVRIADLQTRPLTDLLVRPFNEHVAPFFELVSWTTWQLAARKVSRAAVAFTAMSIVPFVLCAIALGMLIRRETGSLTTALCALAVFCLSPVHAECVWWYSASSFVWALLASILTWVCALSAVERRESPGRSVGWWLGAVVAAAAAPACSTIGQLAGPLAVFRAALAPGLTGRRRLLSLLPLAGTALYLMIAGGSRYVSLLGASVHQSSHWTEGFLCCFRAPADILLPGLVGLENADRWLGGGPDLAASVLMLVGCGLLSWRRPARPLFLSGLAALVVGYAITYTVRNAFGTHWLLEVPRYHLFPQFGFILVLACVVRPLLRSFDARGRTSFLFATAFALVFLLTNRSLLIARVQAYFFPEQPATLRALDRLEQVCRDQGITRRQALWAMGPIRPGWLRLKSDVLTMLADTVKHSCFSDEEARLRLLAALPLPEREALCGGMDVSTLLRPANPSQEPDTDIVCRLAAKSGFVPTASGQWVARRGPAFLEFDLEQTASPPLAGQAPWLCLPGADSADKIELWWTGQKGKWSEARSVNWRPGNEKPAGERGVPLDCLPHWSSGEFRHLRVLVRSEHPVALLAPRLLR
jgi:hypothetical protein